MWEGEGDDLVGIRGIGYDFLIVGYCGVEDQFGYYFVCGIKVLVVENGVVGKCQICGWFLGYCCVFGNKLVGNQKQCRQVLRLYGGNFVVGGWVDVGCEVLDKCCWIIV